MRGKVMTGIGNVLPVGITPAYAGKRHQSKNIQQKQKDHPRLCGEKSGNHLLFLMVLGSPPPMRGKGAGFAWLHAAAGITPAYAGKSIRASSLNTEK